MTGYDGLVGMIFFGNVVLMMEQIGGLSCVVYTDVLRGVVMSICFLLLPVILWYDYGNFFNMAPEDCVNLRYFDTNSSRFVDQCEAPPEDPDCALVGCIGNTNPSFLLYPQSESLDTVVFWFVFGRLAYPLNLQLLQRFYVSKYEASLRTVMYSLLVAAVIAYTPSIIQGITHSTFRETFPSGISGHAFFGIMQVRERQGGRLRAWHHPGNHALDLHGDFPPPGSLVTPSLE